MQRRAFLTVVKDTTDVAGGAMVGVSPLLQMAMEVRLLSATIDSLVRRAQ
jgi:hypothetical protein